MIVIAGNPRLRDRQVAGSTFGISNGRRLPHIYATTLLNSFDNTSSFPVGYGENAWFRAVVSGGIGATKDNVSQSAAAVEMEAIEDFESTGNACASSGTVDMFVLADMALTGSCTTAATASMEDFADIFLTVSTSAEPTPEQLASEVFATLIYDRPFREWMQVLAAFLAGESSGRTPSGGTILFRKPGAPSTTVITGTLDANNNRTSVTVTP